MTIASHFREMCFGLGIGCDEVALENLVNRYNELHRYYHTVAHIDACLALFDGIGHAHAERPAEVMAALLYHDAVYRPGHRDNELSSADLARRDLSKMGAAGEAHMRIARMILATESHGKAETADEQLVLDIDLSILGADEATFEKYEEQIRHEYAFVEKDAFRNGRRRILQEFAQRKFIFWTPVMYERFEEQARRNLVRAIARL
jgi:predicted metal-dependent HD superfamily phosphohydrolase